jgi:hypothetical protein
VAHLQQAEARLRSAAVRRPSRTGLRPCGASLRRAGRKANARAYDDAMIAATVLANGLPVYTCNPNDFVGIEGLDVVLVPIPEDSPPSRRSGPGEARRLRPSVARRRDSHLTSCHPVDYRQDGINSAASRIILEGCASEAGLPMFASATCT